ncbi:D-hexose-6-phosphate mutarotase [Variovorax saccharolyticus]|uniref:D-hexose-6-phosphate mutarotase n=1 Tax=Variovorax saccharolyticus TaxID=3053516 RepID=UPI0025755FF8|nr:D-hexose-6-phosphate mutarotase [Variovorax sp. J31P216]MDM0024938.1 D-hexose-6-phosphate mutarotase [Variovorax sp. J31P216]
MTLQALVFRGQPAVRLALPGGDSCTVALHGAHVLSWTTADGVERLYLSPEARFDGQSPIRGGIPVCWPQFNQRGPLPKHGFARNLPWTAEPQPDERRDTVVLALRDGAATRALWPHAFRARLAVTLAAHSLRVALTIDNLGGEPWSFAAALHSYLRVDEATEARLEGLQGANRWDAVRDDRHVEMAPALAFGSEFDSVYAAPARPLRLVQPSGTLEISQSASCTETVVWNPGPLLAAKLDDLPDDGWRHMLCVEAARIDESVLLAPGGQWQGWQQLKVA